MLKNSLASLFVLVFLFLWGLVSVQAFRAFSNVTMREVNRDVVAPFAQP